MTQIMKQPTQNTNNFILMQSKKLDNKLGFQSLLCIYNVVQFLRNVKFIEFASTIVFSIKTINIILTRKKEPSMCKTFNISIIFQWF